MKPESRYWAGFWLWAGSCFASFILGMGLEDFTHRSHIDEKSEIRSTRLNDGRNGLVLHVESTKDRRYSEDNYYTFVETSPGKYLPPKKILKNQENQAVKENKDPTTRVIHEYIDTNTNGLYDYHRCVFETGSERKIYSEGEIGAEFSKGDLKTIPRSGNEIRFYSNKEKSQ